MTTANPDEDELIHQLYPDQETYKREEQRSLKILLALWDLPVSNILPVKKIRTSLVSNIDIPLRFHFYVASERYFQSSFVLN